MPAIFREIGAALVEQDALACEYAVPEVDGEFVDPEAIRLSYLPGSNLPSLPLDAVTVPGECTSTGYFASESNSESRGADLFGTAPPAGKRTSRPRFGNGASRIGGIERPL
jgi:hypothetical protein